ncbi:hypothetical protein Mame01_08140 [Microbispora amethystogenes]|nr:hypothetical protein Mame01_08140 [Microbispora amethystogenes]
MTCRKRCPRGRREDPLFGWEAPPVEALRKGYRTFPVCKYGLIRKIALSLASGQDPRLACFTAISVPYAGPCGARAARRITGRRVARGRARTPAGSTAGVRARLFSARGFGDAALASPGLLAAAYALVDDAAGPTCPA